MTRDEQSRAWVLDGMPVRNRIAYKYIHPLVTAPYSVTHLDPRRRLVHSRVWRIVCALVKKDSGPNTEAINTKVFRDYPHVTFHDQMITPRMVKIKPGEAALSNWTRRGLAALRANGFRSVMPIGMTRWQGTDAGRTGYIA